MAQIVSGQLRLMEQSSILNSKHSGIGIGHGKLVSLPLKDERQTHPNIARDVSHRGHGQGERGEIEGTEDLRRGSTYTEPFAHFSVGFEAELEAPEDLDKHLIRRSNGGRNIIIPSRMGKNDKSGMSLPNKKLQVPPKKKSDIVKKEKKRVNKIIRNNDKGEGPEHTLHHRKQDSPCM